MCGCPYFTGFSPENPFKKNKKLVLNECKFRLAGLHIAVSLKSNLVRHETPWKEFQSGRDFYFI